MIGFSKIRALFSENLILKKINLHGEKRQYKESRSLFQMITVNPLYRSSLRDVTDEALLIQGRGVSLPRYHFRTKLLKLLSGFARYFRQVWENLAKLNLWGSLLLKMQ